MGVALWITMFGATASDRFCVRSEFLLLPEGGGDFSRGLMGQEGVVLSEGVLDPRAGLGTREAGSEDCDCDCEDWSCGVVAAERARWIAAAEGTLDV
jgi:hypothetical protein